MITYDEPIDIDLRELKPLRDWLVIERIWDDDSPSIILKSIRPKPNRGRVLRIGPGKRFPDGTRKPMLVKPGDIVQYQSSDIDTKDLVLLQEADILFIECPNR